MIARVLYSHSYNPWFNLALEDWLLRSCKGPALLLYRNAPCVVIGRFQNPWLECQVETMRKDQVSLVRRQSGGGAVYHDPGNVNFCFVDDDQVYSVERNLDLVRQTLSCLGVKTEISKRKDILYQGLKISGSAYKAAGSRRFHHGTLLLKGDLSRLQVYLKPQISSEEVETRAVSSVRSPVANIGAVVERVIGSNDIYQAFYDALTYAFRLQHRALPSVVDQADESLMELQEVATAYQKFQSDQWIWGKSPAFQRRSTGLEQAEGTPQSLIGASL